MIKYFVEINIIVFLRYKYLVGYCKAKNKSLVNVY